MGCMVTNVTIHTWRQKLRVIVVKCERALNPYNPLVAIIKFATVIAPYEGPLTVIGFVWTDLDTSVIFYYVVCMSTRRVAYGDTNSGAKRGIIQ